VKVAAIPRPLPRDRSHAERAPRTAIERWQARVVEAALPPKTRMAASLLIRALVEHGHDGFGRCAATLAQDPDGASALIELDRRGLVRIKPDKVSFIY